ncbi:MAG: branched-chain amino acid ABC transporter permease [Dehalococcoidia bacterium]|nr:branched-chain amino acid ABC transporter permease [Dehalococcoidia bacterium]
MLAKASDKWVWIVAGLLLVLLILIPFKWFLGPYTNLMIFIAIYTMVTLGLCLLMGYSGQVSLGQAAFFGIGAYFSAILSKTYGVNPWLAMLLGATATGAFAYVIGIPIFRLRGNYLAMATLGLGIIIYILFRQLGQYTGGPDGMAGIPYLSVGGFAFNTAFRRYFLIWGFCLASLLVSQRIVNSRTGRALRAIHGSEPAAESVGISVSFYKVKIFVLSAVLSSLAGSLYVHHLRFVSPQSFDFLASVVIVVMAAIGGLASIWGAIFGAAAIRILGDEILPRFENLSLLKSWDLDYLNIIVYGLLLIVVMVFMPQGLFVGMRDAFERWRLKHAQREAVT